MEVVAGTVVQTGAARVYGNLISNHEIAEDANAESAVREEFYGRVARGPRNHLLDDLRHVDRPGTRLGEEIGEFP